MADEKTITIGGHEFNVRTPYAEGHTISAVEAKVLNQTRAENVANNIRKAVNGLKDIADESERAAKLTELRSKFAAYDAEYAFSSGGVARIVLDPVEREALAIAKQAIKALAKEKGIKVEDIAEDKYNTMLERLVSSEDVLKRAKERVKLREKEKSIDSSGLADLL